MFLTPIPQFVRLGWCGIYYIRKDVYLTFCLWRIKTSQLLKTSSKNKATVDVCGICFIFCEFVCLQVCENAIHIGVGFCVACSDEVGQCEGLDAWDKQQVQIPALFLYNSTSFSFNESSSSGSLQTT